MRFPHLLKYLHEKPLPRNPLWYPGNPRHRIFLPLYWMKAVKPTRSMPKDFVKFECHWQMSSNDVKQYLEKVYQIPVLDVRVEIQKGEIVEHPKGAHKLAPPLDDRKFVYVQLKEGEFEFPDIFGSKDPVKEAKTQEKAMTSVKNREKNKYIRRLDLGSWFQ
jgi:large subunit ribosomal protein L23